MPEHVPATSTLVEKLNPRGFSHMSGMMAAIVGCILGQQFTEPEMHGLAISSDGCVTSMDTFIGSVVDFERNIAELLKVADLTPEERAEWDRLYAARIDDWRNPRRTA